MCGHLLQSHLVLAASQRPTPQTAQVTSERQRRNILA